MMKPTNTHFTKFDLCKIKGLRETQLNYGSTTIFQKNKNLDKFVNCLCCEGSNFDIRRICMELEIANLQCPLFNKNTSNHFIVPEELSYAPRLSILEKNIIWFMQENLFLSEEYVILPTYYINLYLKHLPFSEDGQYEPNIGDIVKIKNSSQKGVIINKIENNRFETLMDGNHHKFWSKSDIEYIAIINSSSNIICETAFKAVEEIKMGDNTFATTLFCDFKIEFTKRILKLTKCYFEDRAYFRTLARNDELIILFKQTGPDQKPTDLFGRIASPLQKQLQFNLPPELNSEMRTDNQSLIDNNHNYDIVKVHQAKKADTGKKVNDLENIMFIEKEKDFENMYEILQKKNPLEISINKQNFKLLFTYQINQPFEPVDLKKGNIKWSQKKHLRLLYGCLKENLKLTYNNVHISLEMRNEFKIESNDTMNYEHYKICCSDELNEDSDEIKRIYEFLEQIYMQNTNKFVIITYPDNDNMKKNTTMKWINHLRKYFSDYQD